MSTWLILDCNYLCYRAMYALGELSFEGEGTGAAFGFLRDVKKFQEYFTTDRVVFSFDSDWSLRKQAYPAYKAARPTRATGAPYGRDLMRKQIGVLRDEILPGIGYRNIFWQRGYESDDVIASVCGSSLTKGDFAVVVSSDKDLYQLLHSDRVVMHNPHTKKTISESDFRRDYGIRPSQWPLVKALCGCKSDNVRGVPKVGEKTALAIVQGRVPKPGSKTRASYDAHGSVVDRNLPLVTLPYPGVGTFALMKDGPLDLSRWNAVARKFGMKSLEVC